MSGFLNAVSACVVLFMMMGVGYFMGGRGWMTAREKKFVSLFIINIAVPCNCLVGVLDNLDRSGLVQAGVQLASGFAGVGVTLLVSMAAAWVLRLPRARWGVFVAMAGLSNVLYIGIPVCTQLFGAACMPYLMVYYLANTSFLQSAGFMLIEHAGAKQGTRTGALGWLKKFLGKPPILGLLAAVLLLSLGLRPPGPVMRFASYISGAVTPLALIYCGFIVYEVGLKNLRLLPGLPTMLVIRLAAAPVICWGSCVLFGVTGLARDVFIVESALPVVSQATVMAGAYGADEQYAAVGSCLSVLVSFVTIPVLMLLIG